MRTLASCPFIETHWSFSPVNRVAVAFVWLVLPICAVHFRDEKCCCSCFAQGELGKRQQDNEWETCGGYQSGTLRGWATTINMVAFGEVAWKGCGRAAMGFQVEHCLPLCLNHLCAGPCRSEVGWQCLLRRNKTPQWWPGGSRDVAADLRSHSDFVAHSLTN